LCFNRFDSQPTRDVGFPNHRLSLRRRGASPAAAANPLHSRRSFARRHCTRLALEDASPLDRPGCPGAFHRVVQRTRPSVDIIPGVLSRSPCGALRSGAATLPTRAAFVVPPHLDGFLLHGLRRLVASCSRPWGSPRFHFRDTSRNAPRPLPRRCLHPSEPSPPEQPFLRHRRPFPPRRCRAATRSTSRPSSTRESVASPLRCRTGHARCSPGLPIPGALSVSSAHSTAAEAAAVQPLPHRSGACRVSDRGPRPDVLRGCRPSPRCLPYRPKTSGLLRGLRESPHPSRPSLRPDLVGAHRGRRLASASSGPPRGVRPGPAVCGSDTSSIPSVEPAATRGCALWSLVSSRRTGVRVKKETRPPACLPERRSRGLVPAPESTPGRPPPRVAPRVGLFGPPDGPHASPRASSSFMPLSAPGPKPGPRQRGVRGRRRCRPGRPPKRPRGVAARLPDRGP
jgi:hypothetical protein